VPPRLVPERLARGWIDCPRSFFFERLFDAFELVVDHKKQDQHAHWQANANQSNQTREQHFGNPNAWIYELTPLPLFLVL
jgi:hypothetical protein